MLSRSTILGNIKLVQFARTFSTSRILQSPENVKMWIDGGFVESQTTQWIDLTNPATGKVIKKVPKCTQSEMQSAVDSCKKAYKSWQFTSPILRTQLMYSIREKILQNKDKLAEIMTLEHGKTIAESLEEIERGLQVIEHACAAPILLKGENLQGLAKDVDTKSMRIPLGVCASITPFNFPIMCSLWMAPLALVSGNTMIMKPSESDPSSVLMLATMFKKAGVPDGCINVIHGQHDAVNFICDNPDIKAISFVGGNRAGEHIYERASKAHKRVQCNMGAKCLSVIMPDAHKASAIKRMIAGAFGAAGQRCLALCTAILVGDAKKWIPEIVEDAKQIKVGNGCDKSSNIRPMISKSAQQRCIDLISSAEQDGCRILLDGKNAKVAGHENGYFVTPTVIEGVKEHMKCYKEEIFGPVLLLMTADTLDEAIEIINRNPFGNGTTIFTNSGSTVRRFTETAEPALMGVNIPVPIAMSMFSFTGNKASYVGDLALVMQL